MKIDLHDGFYLSPIRDGDQAAYVEHFRDRDTTDRLLKIPYPYTEEDAAAWVNSRLEAAKKCTYETSFAFRRPDGFLIGGAGLVLNSNDAASRGEIGYWIAKDYRGRGLATAAVAALTQYAFQHLKLHRIEATTSPQNYVSHRVLEKAGFQHEDILAGFHSKNGILQDAYLYSLVNPNLIHLRPRQFIGAKANR